MSSNNNNNNNNNNNPSYPNNKPTNKPSTLKTSQACAACKYQRRRCNPDCTLAPYFPAENQPQFLNAHRLFGVSNILKLIRHLDPHLRDEAMRSIIFESNARAVDPVGGCYRMVTNLHLQIARDSAELDCVLQQLALFRGCDNVNYVNGNVVVGQQQDLGEFGYLCYDGNVEGEEVVVVDGNGDSAGLEMEMLSLEQREDQGDSRVVVDEKVEVADFVDAFDFSAKSLDLKEETNGIGHVQEQDLKEAASLFTLTNYI